MRKTENRKTQFIRWVVITLIIAAATYGFASHSTLHIGGQDYGVKSIYQIDRVQYTLDEQQPEYFTAIEFSLDDASGPIHAGVSQEKNGPVTWAESCTIENQTVSCDFRDSIHVLKADWLHVVDVQ